MDDEDQIRLTLALHAQRLDDGDADGYAALYTEDGQFTSAAGTHVGQAAIRQFIGDLFGARSSERASKHLFGNTVMSVVGDVAEAVTDVSISQRVGDGPWTMGLLNRHFDRLVRRGDQWLFAEKRVVRR
jgi:ketosteroid isomerase-like protein